VLVTWTEWLRAKGLRLEETCSGTATRPRGRVSAARPDFLRRSSPGQSGYGRRGYGWRMFVLSADGAHRPRPLQGRWPSLGAFSPMNEMSQALGLALSFWGGGHTLAASQVSATSYISQIEQPHLPLTRQREMERGRAWRYRLSRGAAPGLH
jgi:hypothetical protein